MAIKKVLLPISGDNDADPLADMALRIAEMFAAKVEALYVDSLPVSTMMFGEATDPATISKIIDAALQQRRQRAERARQAFDRTISVRSDVESSFVSLEGTPEEHFGRRGRLADITVIGTIDDHDSRYWRGVRDAALFRTGRPVLLVPPKGVGGRGLDKVLIAWKEGLEASRAVAAAQPFMTKASEVHLLAIGEGEDTVASLQDLEDYLQLHYAEVRTEAVGPSQRPVSEVLLRRAEELGGAMIVMGAYSHWRWQQRIFGGVTDHMLRESTVPILMMH